MPASRHLREGSVRRDRELPTSTTTDHLDAASEALRAWCHARPDRADPSTIYHAFGTITSIVSTLAHIVDRAAQATGRATGSDDDRAVDAASDEVQSLTGYAICKLNDAVQVISRAHEVVSHLIFAADDEVAPGVDRGA